eukprot:6079071-Lingulodinium_polyedra.AAC.1
MHVVDSFKAAIPSTLWRDENPERDVRWHWPKRPECAIVQKILVQEAVVPAAAVPAAVAPAAA